MDQNGNVVIITEKVEMIGHGKTIAQSRKRELGQN